MRPCERGIFNLDDTGLQIGLVISAEGTLLGTVTGGDSRRGLFRSLELGSSIQTIVHRDPVVMPSELGRETVLRPMQANKIRELPIVNEQRRAWFALVDGVDHAGAASQPDGDWPDRRARACGL